MKNKNVKLTPGPSLSKRGVTNLPSTLVFEMFSNLWLKFNLSLKAKSFKVVTPLLEREGPGVSLKNFSFIIFLFLVASCSNEPTSTPTTPPKAKTDVAAQPSTSKATTKKKKKIIFFGDSLTFGYGLKDPSKGYVGVIQEILDKKGFEYEAVNSGVSGETSSGGDGRIDWVLNQYEPEIFVLELGANDGLRGINPEVTVKNLQSIIDKVKAKYPDVKIVLAGMLAPPNMGKEFTDAFAKIYTDLAKTNNAALIPFILDGVAGIPELNQRDRIHPTEEGHVILADNVWKVIEKIL